MQGCWSKRIISVIICCSAVAALVTANPQLGDPQCNGEPVEFKSCQLQVVNTSTLVETICNDSNSELSIPVEINGYSGNCKQTIAVFVLAVLVKVLVVTKVFLNCYLL